MRKSISYKIYSQPPQISSVKYMLRAPALPWNKRSAVTADVWPQGAPGEYQSEVPAGDGQVSAVCSRALRVAAHAWVSQGARGDPAASGIKRAPQAGECRSQTPAPARSRAPARPKPLNEPCRGAELGLAARRGGETPLSSWLSTRLQKENKA